MSIVLNRPFYQVCHQHQGGNDSFAQIHIVHFIFPESFTFKGKSSQHQHRPFSFLSKFQISQEIWHCRASKTAPGSCQPLSDSSIFLLTCFPSMLTFSWSAKYCGRFVAFISGILCLVCCFWSWLHNPQYSRSQDTAMKTSWWAHDQTYCQTLITSVWFPLLSLKNK